MHVISPSVFSAHDASVDCSLPPVLACSPYEVACTGGFAFRSFRTSRLHVLSAPLLLGCALSIEANAQVLDLVTLEDVLAEGAPGWAVEIVDRLDGELAPAFLVRAMIAGRVMTQAVTVGSTAAIGALASSSARRAVWNACRERGVVWSLMTESDVSPVRSATLLWLARAAAMPVESHVVEALADAVTEADARVPLSIPLLQTAATTGVSMPTLLSAFARLVIAGGSPATMSQDVIRTDVPVSGRTGAWECEAAAVMGDMWRETFSTHLVAPALI